MEYAVVAERTIHDLEQTVNRLIREGWIPHGGVCAVPIAHSCLGEMSCYDIKGERSYHDIKVEYLQAIVRQPRSGTQTT